MTYDRASTRKNNYRSSNNGTEKTVRPTKEFLVMKVLKEMERRRGTADVIP